MEDQLPHYDSSASVDAAFADPRLTDPNFPPSFTQFVVESGGTNIPVKMWLAGGPGPKGTVIISPPMGGWESMNSVAIPLMYAGIHVVSYRPRGVRDPHTTYSMPRSVDDVHAIIDWIVANSSADKTALSGPPLRLDPGRIAMFGLSGGGGNVSYAVCAESEHAHYAIAVAPGNIDIQTTPAILEKMLPMFRELKEATRGRSDYELWINAMTSAEKNRISINHNAPKLVSKHLLLLGASHDALSPIEVCHKPIANALRESGAKDLTDLILETDHAFLTKRFSLARIMIEWLRSQGFSAQLS
ncbi:alpha/beta hydrolase family protein [Sphingobium mellinum]|uniref:alpha/beta hydrolase family protein n=1 Tax=Sphingobium mellinum TaxID=1387166 RepID=UPI0030EE3B71